MGNKISSNNSGKLKIAKYPIDIAEDKWIASGNNNITITSKQNKEEKLISSKIERRIRAEPDDYKDFNIDEKQITNNTYNYKNEINNIVQLRMQFPNKLMLGSGVIIHHTLYRTFILTAAHNIVDIDENDYENVIYVESIWIEINKNKKNSGYNNLKRYDCCDYTVHPKYIKYLKDTKIQQSQTGYDIAVIEVFNPQKELRKIKTVKLVSYNPKIMNNMKVKVIGYPDEENLRGELYGMMGDAEIKYTNKQIQINKLITYDNIDTTGGQSGCPIFIVRDSDIKNNDEKYDENIYKSLDEVVGIHVSGKKLNFGSLLNDELIEWIYKCINCHYNKYEYYDIGVLLFTSSRTKYSKRLDKMCTKCVKTEIIHTTRLYYDYKDEEIVNKQDVLFYLKQFFKSKRDLYIIFYCGESDMNGNWIINNNKMDNISLNEINIIANRKYNKSKFFIVSDCNYSGNWVKLFKKNNIFGNIYVIQASSKNNEVCNVGTFTAKYAKCCFEYQPKNDMSIRGIGAIGGVVTGVVSFLTVGTLYDGMIKQPYHKATKQSQPTKTDDGVGWIIGHSRDGIYQVGLYCYSSWYHMDSNLTAAGGFTVGSAGTRGFY